MSGKALFFSSKELGVLQQTVTDLLSDPSLSKRQRISIFKRACRLFHDSRLVDSRLTIKAMGIGTDLSGEPGVVLYLGPQLDTIEAQMPGDSNVDR